MILSAERLCKSYGGREILLDCSFTVNTGQCLVIRGPSGGGKSTLLRILSLLEPADSGCVFHGDRRWDVSSLQKASAYPFLTLVFKQLFLWPNLTMRQNLSMVLAHRPNHPLPRAAVELLERLAIAELLDRRPHQCSLGERQRLAIARSLLSEARFLLLDEPSSALDRANRTALIEELKSTIARDRGVVLITHDDDGYGEVVDQSFELENGRLRQL